MGFATVRARHLPEGTFKGTTLLGPLTNMAQSRWPMDMSFLGGRSVRSLDRKRLSAQKPYLSPVPKFCSL